MEKNYGIIKIKDSTQPKYDLIYDFEEEMAVVRKKFDRKKRYGYINNKKEEIFPCILKEAYNFHEGLALIKGESGYMFINKLGNIIINLGKKYSKVSSFYGGMAVVVNDSGHYGYINLMGEEIIPCKYFNAGNFIDGLAFVQGKNDKWGYINLKGEKITQCQYDKVSYFSEGLALVEFHDDKFFIDENGFYHKIGKNITFSNIKFLENFKKGYALALIFSKVSNDKSDAKKVYIDKQGNIIYDENEIKKIKELQNKNDKISNNINCDDLIVYCSNIEILRKIIYVEANTKEELAELKKKILKDIKESIIKIEEEDLEINQEEIKGQLTKKN